MSDKLKDLSQEEKEHLVNKVNEDLKSEDSKEEGNTSLFNMSDIDEKAGQGSPQEQYDKCVSANVTSLATLHNILSTKDPSYQISRKNLIKLIFATLKLPEEGSVLKFGGTKEQQQVCEFAYAQMQLAANTRAFVLSVNAMREQRRAMKLAEEKNKSSQEEQSDKSQDVKENSND